MSKIGSMARFFSITTTTADRAVAELIARAVIERSIAACARIFSADSVYRWEGEVCAAAEFVVEIKTTEGARRAVEDAIAAFHDYDLPEIVAHEIVGGSAAYLAWIESQIRLPA